MATTKQVLAAYPPKPEQRSLTLTLQCDCGNRRSFVIDKASQLIIDRQATCQWIASECLKCGRVITAGFGWIEKVRGFSYDNPLPPGHEVVDNTGLANPDELVDGHRRSSTDIG